MQRHLLEESYEVLEAIDGLAVRGDPLGTVIAFGAQDPDALDIFAIGEKLSAQGWYLDRQNRPDSLHATVHAVTAVGRERTENRSTTYGQGS